MITYQPMFRVHGTTTWTNFGSPISGNTVTITGLSSGVQYDFEVQAINAFGSSTSNVVSITTTTSAIITSVSLSSQSFIAGSVPGTQVGTISVGMSAGSFAGTLALSGPDASFFQIVGSALQVKVSGTTARNYDITITASQTGLADFPQRFASIIGSPSQTEAAEGLRIATLGPIMNASTALGVADPSGPWLVFSLVAANNQSINVVSGQTSLLTTSNDVVAIVYHNHTCFQTNTAGGWWYWNTALPLAAGNWVEYGVSSTSISASTYTVGDPIGKLIGTVNVQMKNPPAFNGTFTVSDPTNSFKMVGNQLQARVQLNASSYPNVLITAIPAITTDGSAQQIGETSPITFTVAPAGTVTAPAIATNAGYHTLVWSDDFTVNSIGNSGSGFGGGRQWWPGNQDHVALGDVVVNTTMTAGTTPLGIGAGTNASPNGGILVLNGSNPSNGGNGFIMSTSDSATSLPTTAQGVFNKIYIEFYLAYDPSARINSGLGSSGSLWFPAVWSWTWEGRHSGGFGFGGGGGGSDSATSTEIDFMEEQSGVFFGNTPGKNIGFQGYFPGGGGAGVFDSGSFSGITTPQWHTYGFLWDQSNNISFYRDGVQGSSPFLITNVNGAFGSQHLFITMGTGYQWPIYLDWVRVWGTP